VKEKIVALLKPDASTEAKLSVISLFIGKMMEVYEKRINYLEERQLQKGEQGDQGIPGKDGRDGRDGKEGQKGQDGKDGLNGKDGKPGAKGKDGTDGVSVVGAEVAPDEHLVLNLSNGNIIDAGKLPKAKASAGKDRVHVAGNAFQVTVSATAPASPQINDLWLDIS
jgi:hypothetical protein